MLKAKSLGISADDFNSLSKPKFKLIISTPRRIGKSYIEEYLRKWEERIHKESFDVIYDLVKGTLVSEEAIPDQKSSITEKYKIEKKVTTHEAIPNLFRPRLMYAPPRPLFVEDPIYIKL